MINILRHTVLQYTSTLEVVWGRGGGGDRGGLGVGVEGTPRGRRGGGGGRGGAHGLEVVAGQHVGGGAVGAVVVAAAQAVLALLLGVGAHQIKELRAPAPAAREGGGGGGGGGEAEDLLVHELRRVHRAGPPRRRRERGGWGWRAAGAGRGEGGG